jgi:UDP-N-acetylmuramoyl-L-alanyl-D-glutamate--2,6-diaminopimelate ligase
LNIDNTILTQIKASKTLGNLPSNITGLQINSMLITAGNLFVAIDGTVVDGNNYIDGAIINGATIIVTEKLPLELKENIAYVEVRNASYAAGILAHIFYGEVSKKVKVIGVTGTNGKTTVATMLHQLFTALGYTCGLISTVQNLVGNVIIKSTHTTPDAIALQALFADMHIAGCTYIFMEVSSHALQQNRVAGIQFTGAIFTNVSQDHLDYHKTMLEYIDAKKLLFDGLNEDAFAVINADDKRGAVMVQNTEANIAFYSLQQPAPYKAKIIENDFHGLHLQINNIDAYFRLIGEFNAYNILAVYAAAHLCGIAPENILQHLSAVKGAEGRFEILIAPKNSLTAIVDYAHTPDAIKNVLATIKRINQNEYDVITVIGCGGNRDKEKRPLMAAVACEHSTMAIFTTDNPRTENAQDIINDMQNNMLSAHRRKCLVIPDRKEAIKTAISTAKQGSIVLVAGKGHEKYQEINGEKFPFDDIEVVNEMFEMFER